MAKNQGGQYVWGRVNKWPELTDDEVREKNGGQIILDVRNRIKVFDPKKFGNPLQVLSRELE